MTSSAEPAQEGPLPDPLMPETERPQSSARTLADRHIRLAIVLAFLVPLYKYIPFLFFTLQDIAPESCSSIQDPLARETELEGPPASFLATIIPISLAVLFLYLYKFTRPILLLVSILFHFFLGGQTSLTEWNNTTYRATWRLPYATGIALILLFLYDSYFKGGWPADVIFGSLFNILGAWCYLSIFVAWYHLRHSTSRLY